MYLRDITLDKMNMKRLYVLVGVVSLAVFAGRVHSEPGGQTPSEQSPATEINHGMEEQFAIPANRLLEFEHSALSGDNGAAARVSEYFSLYQQDQKQGMYWLQIEAENGSPYAQYNLAILLTNVLPPRDAERLKQDRIRACFWLAKAMANKLTHDRASSAQLSEHCLER
jgi:TPR repeat protein